MKKVAVLGGYAVWGIFLCLAALEKFGDIFAAGTGFWSVVMLLIAGICQLGAGIIAIGWAVLTFGTLKAKYLPYKFINHYTIPVLIVLLAIVASIARSSSDESRAENWVLRTVKSLPLLVKIILRILLIMPNL
ncbi:hypothetical protein QM201_20755 [Enterobacter asburiae]|nr:hypothetical protein [Enterobacter asburiae]